MTNRYKSYLSFWLPTIALTLLLGLSPALAFASTISAVITPTTGTNGNSSAAITSTFNGCSIFVFDPSGNQISTWTLNSNAPTDNGASHGLRYEFLTQCNTNPTWPLSITDPTTGTYTLFLGGGNMTQSGSSPFTLSQMESYAGANYGVATYTLTSGGGGGGSTFESVVDGATTTFAGTTGMSLDDTLAWAVANFYDLFLGSGLALLYTLRGWIVAIIMISAVIYFAYRLYQFFRH